MKLTQNGLNSLAFIIGLGSVTQVDIGITHLSFSEVLLSLIAPFLLVKGHSLKGSSLKLLLGFLSLWILAAIVSDVYINNTYRIFALKGIVRLIILGFCIYSLHFVFLQNPLVWRYYVTGAFFSLILGFTVFKMASLEVDELAGEVRGHDWRQTYNYIFWAFIAVLNAWLYKRYPFLICILLVLAGLFSLALGSRSAGGIGVLAGIVLMYYTLALKNNYSLQLLRLSFLKIAGAAILTLLCATMLFFTYSFMAKAGWLGEEAQIRYEIQSQRKLGLLLGGRRETVAAAMAVLDAPIFGHGSFALDLNGYWLRALELLGDYGERERYFRQGGLSHIPAHSKVLEAWMTHGFLGALFWFYLLYFYLKFVNRGLLLFPPLLGVLTFLLVNAFWHYLFSPITFRVVEASGIALIFAIADRQKMARRGRQRTLFSIK